MAGLSFTVELYEDNSGRLYLHPERSNFVYEVSPRSAVSFKEDAQALIDDETRARRDWSREWVNQYRDIAPLLDHPETQCIATYGSGQVTFTLHRPPGRAGEQYLGLPRDGGGMQV